MRGGVGSFVEGDEEANLEFDIAGSMLLRVLYRIISSSYPNAETTEVTGMQQLTGSNNTWNNEPS